jgi:hypothetical protein
MVRVLDGGADRDDQHEPLAGGEFAVVAKGGDRRPLDQLHHEQRAAVVGRPGVEDFRNVGVVHQGQRLTLRLEPRHHLPAVHPGRISLRATTRLTRCVCSATQTSPIPPSPIGSSNRYRPATTAPVSGRGAS